MSYESKTANYPIMEKCSENVRPVSGRSIDEINIENVLERKLTLEDGRISRETLRMQAQIAAEAGYKQISENLIRAMELVSVPDEVVLDTYNAMRPYRATKDELMEIAETFEKEYNSPSTASFIREAAAVLEKKKMLKGDR